MPHRFVTGRLGDYTCACAVNSDDASWGLGLSGEHLLLIGCGTLSGFGSIEWNVRYYTERDAHLPPDADRLTQAKIGSKKTETTEGSRRQLKARIGMQRQTKVGPENWNKPKHTKLNKNRVRQGRQVQVGQGRPSLAAHNQRRLRKAQRSSGRPRQSQIGENRLRETSAGTNYEIIVVLLILIYFGQ